MAKVNGKDAILYKFNDTTDEWVPFGCARSISLDISREMVETSITGNGVFKTYVPGAGSVSGTIEGLVFLSLDSPDLVNMKELYDLIINGTTFNIKYYEKDTTNTAFLVKELTVLLESLNETASFDNMVTFSANFVGIGAPIITEGNPSVPRTLIGSKYWSTVNFDGTTYKNGDTIPQATNQTEWNSYDANEIGAWCYYQFNPAFANFGKLYNYHAVLDSRGIGYAGWHVPTSADITDLENYIAASTIGPSELMSTDSTYWEVVYGTNESGLSLIGSGIQEDTGGYAKRQQAFLYYINTGAPVYFYIDLNTTWGLATSTEYGFGMSLRFVQD